MTTEVAAARRPLSNLIETAALRKVREEQFVDDAEMERPKVIRLHFVRDELIAV